MPKKLSKQEIWQRQNCDRKCRDCGKTKRPNEFPSNIHYLRCKECQRAIDKNYRDSIPDFNAKRRTAHLKHKFGITDKEYQKMFVQQKGLCGICQEPISESLDIDHDHTKERGEDGFIRGLLCNSCNRGLGLFKDNPKLLQRAIDYLRGRQ